MDFLRILLIFVVTFIAAIDQFNFLESLYQPIVLGPIIGAILGDVTTGLAYGGTYQLMTIGSMPVGGAQPPNAVIGGIVGTIFAVTQKASLSVEAAVGLAVPFALIGQLLITTIFTLMSPLMKWADTEAENANPAGITKINLTAMGLLGLSFGIVGVIAYVGGTSLAEPIQAFFTKYEWIKIGLEVGGGMLRYVGFAILLKIMLSNELWGYFFAGFAAATLIGHIEALSGSALLLIAFIGLAIAIADYQSNVRIKQAGLAAGSQGGDEDGI